MQFSYNWNAKETSSYSDKSCLVGAVIFSNNIDPTTFSTPKTIIEYATQLRSIFAQINGAFSRVPGHSYSNEKENYSSGQSTGINTVTGFKYVLTIMDANTKKNYSIAGVEVTNTPLTAVERIQAKILNDFGINLEYDELGDNDYFIKNMIVEVY